MEVKKIILNSCEIAKGLITHEKKIELAITFLENAFRSKRRLLVAGNGGSAADAQHFVAELVGRFYRERRALDAIALTTNSSVVTCLANDYAFDMVFARQIEAHGSPGDVFCAISTSGHSKNLIEALKKAKKEGLRTIALLGKGGGDMADLADCSIIVDSNETPRIQEAHILLIHIFCELLEQRLFPTKKM